MKSTNTFFIAIFIILIITASSTLYADEDIYGKYCIENAVDDYQGTRYFEIKRNQYQEYEIIADNSFDCIAFYDSDKHELFCVIERSHQYSTLMKFSIQNNTLTVNALINDKWYQYPNSYKKIVKK